MAENNTGKPETGADSTANADASVKDTLRLGEVLAVDDANDPCNVTSNLHFRFDSASGNTLVELKSPDGEALGQPVVLRGDLTSGGSLSDSQVIQLLLAQGKLPTDI